MKLLTPENWISPRTHFVHHFHGKTSASDTIPVYENVCYALWLLRTRQADNVIEAKRILSKLLHFQNTAGGFPPYLHLFPGDFWEVNFLMLIPMYWIQKLFGKFVDISEAYTKLLVYCKDKTPPSHAQFCYEVVTDSHVKMPEVSTADAWGHVLFASEVIPDHPLRAQILTEAKKMWHPTLCHFTGESLKYQGYAPELTVMDLFFANFASIYPKRLVDSHWIHLLESLSFSKGNLTEVTSDVSEIDNRITWGDKDLHYSLQIISPSEIYFTHGIDWKVNGEKATLFYATDQVILTGADKTISLQWEGEGKFIGTLSRGNRPAQQIRDVFSAYDWVLKMRALEGDLSDLSVRVEKIF